MLGLEVVARTWGMKMLQSQSRAVFVVDGTNSISFIIFLPLFSCHSQNEPSPASHSAGTLIRISSRRSGAYRSMYAACFKRSGTAACTVVAR